MKVLNMGSLNLDYVYQVDHIVAAAETQSCTALKIYGGGKGLNQSVALSRAGIHVYHGGIVGADGEGLLLLCRENGIDTSLIRVTEGSTGHTVIQVDKNAQNCILLYGGCNLEFTEEYVDAVLGHFGAGDILLMQNEINMPEYIVRRAFERGMRIILNPSPMDQRLCKVDMEKISMFIMNEIEGAQITGRKEPEDILKGLKALYPQAELILTLGKQGSIYVHKDTVIRQEAFLAEAVDTTAAGDTFTGYYIAEILKGSCVKKALDLAARASALTVTRPGAALSIPWRTELIDAGSLKNDHT